MSHELAHAYDHMEGGISHKPAFGEAMVADHQSAIQPDLMTGPFPSLDWDERGVQMFYFHHPRELFADNVTHILGPRVHGGGKPGKRWWAVAHKRFERMFSHSLKFVRERLKADGIL